MKSYKILILIFLSVLLFHESNAQVDTGKLSPTDTVHKSDIVTKADSVKKHDPRKATRRSAIIPGWGQAYNKEAWKIPLVYGALAIPTVMFIYNNDYYKKTKFAYEAKYKAAYSDPKDSSDYKLIDPELKDLSISSLQSYRNSFRRDRDYSVLFFLLAWGLQVVDATVYGHLKDFDVSNSLTMHVNPEFDPTTRTPGLAFTFSPKKPERKIYEIR
jgi:hypothetical protein